MGIRDYSSAQAELQSANLYKKDALHGIYISFHFSFNTRSIQCARFINYEFSVSLIVKKKMIRAREYTKNIYVYIYFKIYTLR